MGREDFDPRKRRRKGWGVSNAAMTTFGFVAATTLGLLWEYSRKLPVKIPASPSEKAGEPIAGNGNSTGAKPETPAPAATPNVSTKKDTESEPVVVLPHESRVPTATAPEIVKEHVDTKRQLAETLDFFTNPAKYASIPLFAQRGFTAARVHDLSEYIIKHNEEITRGREERKVLKDNLKILWTYLQDPNNNSDAEFDKCIDDVFSIISSIKSPLSIWYINGKIHESLGENINLPKSKAEVVPFLTAVFDLRPRGGIAKKPKTALERLADTEKLFAYLGSNNLSIMQGVIPQFMRGVSKTLVNKLGDKNEFTASEDKAALEAFRQVTQLLLGYYTQK